MVIVGGGPTGVEAAGELSNLINRDLRRLYPQRAKSMMWVSPGCHLGDKWGDWMVFLYAPPVVEGFWGGQDEWCINTYPPPPPPPSPHTHATLCP